MCDNHHLIEKDAEYCFACDTIEFDGRTWTPLAEARKVIEPFAKYAETQIDDSDDDDKTILDWWAPFPKIEEIAVGNIRAAAAWLKGHGDPP